MLQRLILVFLMFGLSALSQAFAAGEVFTVRNILVDATAAGAAEARETAIAQGQRVAFDRLVHRLTRKQDWSVAPQASAEQIANMVLGVEVAEERSSTKRYIGRITYTFKPAAVRSFLRQSGIPFSETRSKPALLLPLYDGPDGQHLWGENNPWRTAWARRDLGDELVPIMIPLNDLEDSTYVTPAQAANGTWADVSAIANKYGLDRVLIARATARKSSIDVRLTQVSANASDTNTLSIANTGDPGVLDQAVGASLDRIYEGWKSTTIVTAGEMNTLYVSIWFDNLSDWLTIQRRLKQATTIRQMIIIGLSPKGAEVRFDFGGTVDQLKITLEQLSLALNERGGYWELSMAERTAPGASNGLAPPGQSPEPDANATH